jgi:hypothetical protein
MARGARAEDENGIHLGMVGSVPRLNKSSGASPPEYEVSPGASSREECRHSVPPSEHAEETCQFFLHLTLPSSDERPKSKGVVPMQVLYQRCCGLDVHKKPWWPVS